MPRKRETLGQGPLRKLNVTDKKKLFEQNGLKLVLAVFRGVPRWIVLFISIYTCSCLQLKAYPTILNINKVHKVAVYTQSTITTFITYRDVSLNIFKLFISA